MTSSGVFRLRTDGLVIPLPPTPTGDTKGAEQAGAAGHKAENEAGGEGSMNEMSLKGERAGRPRVSLGLSS